MPIESFENHYIKIKPTLNLTYFVIKYIKNVTDIPKNISFLQNSHKNKIMNCHLTLNDIKWLKLYFLEQRNNCNEKIYIHEILEGVNIQLPEPKVIPRNPELQARIKILQAQQDARDYKAMTKGIDAFRKHLPEDTIAFQMKLINKQLIAVTQFVFSVIAGFTFGFIGIELIVGNLDFGFRLLLGIMCALIIALAEIYFLAKKLNEDYDETIPVFIPKKLHKE